jgi:hypothetical protein
MFVHGLTNKIKNISRAIGPPVIAVVGCPMIRQMAMSAPRYQQIGSDGPKSVARSRASVQLQALTRAARQSAADATTRAGNWDILPITYRFDAGK